MKSVIVFFLLCCTSAIGFSQSITIENNSQEADSNVLKFKEFLIQEKVINPKNNISLRLNPFDPHFEPISLNFSNYTFQSSTFKSFLSTIFFIVSDSTKNISLKGFVLENKVFVNTIDYYRFSHFKLENSSTEEQFNEILQKYYPTYHLDSILFFNVNDASNEPVGYFKIEYKTLALNGCMLNEEYEVISNDHYNILTKNDKCEAVFVFYHKAPAEFNIKGKCYGEQFEMYDRHLELIHKGVVSRYLMNVISPNKND